LTYFVFTKGYLINHPDDIKHVLQENARNYNKELSPYTILKPFLGKGLITNNGDSWLQQRRLIQPAFHRHRLAAFGTLITETVLLMFEQWDRCAATGQPLDMATEMMRVTLRIVGLALFSIDLSQETEILGQTFTTMSKLISQLFYFPPFLLSLPTSRKRRMQATIHKIDQIVYRIIAERRREAFDREDLLSLLLSTQDEETGERMTDQQLRDEIITLLFAGHETTANALSWTWYLLSQYPNVLNCLQQEIDSVLGGQLPTVAHLPLLPYSRMVLDEALRLYPPVYILNRHAVEADELGGYYIPANSSVFISPYTTHRHPAFWEHPGDFDPGRFSPERSIRRHPYAYIPFIGGPRQCIGKHLALMEAQLVLVTVAQRYHFRLLSGQQIEPKTLMTLRPLDGLLMILQKRT